MIDWERVAALRDEVGEDGFALIVDLFLEEVSAALDRLPQVPPAEREAVLHFLKGSALNLGFEALGTLCAEGERRAALGGVVDPAPITALFTASHRAFLAVTVPAAEVKLKAV